MIFGISKRIRRPQKRGILLAMFFSALASPLFFYYWFGLEIPIFVTVPLYSTWIIGLILDMGITITNKKLIAEYEQNIVFHSLYVKYKPATAILIQISIEISFVMLMPFLFDDNNYSIDIQASAIIAGMISVLHFMAWHSNRKTVSMLKRKIQTS